VNRLQSDRHQIVASPGNCATGQKATSHRFVKIGYAKAAHVSECEGKSQKLTSHARLINAIRDGVENSLPEILANFRGPISIGAEYHGNLPQVGLSNHQQPHGGCVGGHEIPLLLYRIDLSDIFLAVAQFHVGRGARQPTRREGPSFSFAQWKAIGREPLNLPGGRLARVRCALDSDQIAQRNEMSRRATSGPSAPQQKSRHSTTAAAATKL
jgi:hypothetical protein